MFGLWKFSTERTAGHTLQIKKNQKKLMKCSDPEKLNAQCSDPANVKPSRHGINRNCNVQTNAKCSDPTNVQADKESIAIAEIIRSGKTQWKMFISDEFSS